MKKFYDLTIPKRVNSLERGIDGAEVSIYRAKELRAILSEVVELAKSRNLVCHNPCFSAVGVGEDEFHSDLILGLRMPSLIEGADIPEVDLAGVESLARQAFTLGQRFDTTLGYIFREFPLDHE